MDKNSLLTLGVALLIGAGVLVFIFSSSGPAENGEEALMNTDVTNETREVETDREMNTPRELPEAEDLGNIVEIAVSDDRFSTLVTAVQQANLVETLSQGGPFTVFAPTNEAFSKIPEETLNEILADEEQLTEILTYHVVQGRVYAADVVNLDSATTLQGGDISIEVMGSDVMLNNATVLQTDIEAENGVIHVIDTVLIPQ